MRQPSKKRHVSHLLFYVLPLAAEHRLDQPGGPTSEASSDRGRRDIERGGDVFERREARFVEVPRVVRGEQSFSPACDNTGLPHSGRFMSAWPFGLGRPLNNHEAPRRCPSGSRRAAIGDLRPAAHDMRPPTRRSHEVLTALRAITSAVRSECRSKKRLREEPSTAFPCLLFLVAT